MLAHAGLHPTLWAGRYNRRLLTIGCGCTDADRVGHHTEMAWDTQPGQTSIYTMCCRPLQLDSRNARNVRPPIFRDMTGKDPDMLQVFREVYETLALHVPLPMTSPNAMATTCSNPIWASSVAGLAIGAVIPASVASTLELGAVIPATTSGIISSESTGEGGGRNGSTHQFRLAMAWYASLMQRAGKFVRRATK